MLNVQRSVSSIFDAVGKSNVYQCLNFKVQIELVQSRIKAVNKMDAEAPERVEVDSVWRFSIPSSEPLGRPIIAINDVTFDYTLEQPDGTKKMANEYLLQKVNFGVDNSSKIAILGANGQVRQNITDDHALYSWFDFLTSSNR